MLQEKLKSDLKRLADTPFAHNLTKQFSAYEDRVREVVHGLELKSREARAQSLKRIDEFTDQLKKTRGQVEKKVSTLLNEEGKRLNAKVTELLNYLKSMARDEKLAQKGKKKSSAKARANQNGAKKRTRKKGEATVSATAH